MGDICVSTPEKIFNIQIAIARNFSVTLGRTTLVALSQVRPTSWETDVSSIFPLSSRWKIFVFRTLVNFVDLFLYNYFIILYNYWYIYIYIYILFYVIIIFFSQRTLKRNERKTGVNGVITPTSLRCNAGWITFRIKSFCIVKLFFSLLLGRLRCELYVLIIGCSTVVHPFCTRRINNALIAV